MNTMQRSRLPWPFDGRQRRTAGLLAGLLGALASAHAAGQVEVDFVNPLSYADAGFGVRQRDANLKVLGDYLIELGSTRLATGQTLKIDVLDVSLAGTRKPLIGSGEMRIVRGGADWPRITLRYSLIAADGQVLQSGNEVLTDLDYLGRIGAITETGSLPYEKRLLADWLKTRFPTAVPIKG